jgi:hypothetical protein
MGASGDLNRGNASWTTGKGTSPIFGVYIEVNLIQALGSILICLPLTFMDVMSC